MKYSRSEAKEAARESFKGVWAALTSPFTESGELDEDGLRRNMRYVTEELELDGVFCTGVMGEYWSLTPQEWRRSIEIVVEEARGRCLVIAHTGHGSVDETVSLTHHAQEVGADFAIMITPVYPLIKSDGGIYEYYKYVCDRVDIGVWLFDGPYAGPGLNPELAARLAEIENIVGMKQAWPLEKHDAYHRLLNDKIVLSQPGEANWLTLIRDYGQQVHMSSPNPYLLQRPGYMPMREYTALAEQGRFDEAEEVNRSEKLEALRALEQKWIRRRIPEEGILPIAWIKAWTSLLGMAAGPVRPPLENVSAEDLEQLRKELEAAGLLDHLATA